MATEDIDKNDLIVKIPAKLLITTKVAFYSDINKIFYENPEVFGKHVHDGEDNVLNAFIMYELGKKEKSFWHPCFQIWPKEADILMNWNSDDLEWL